MAERWRCGVRTVRFERFVAPAVALLAVAALGPARAQTPATVPVAYPATACLYIPPWLESRVVYYNPFEGAPDAPTVNTIEAETIIGGGIAADGLAGAGLKVAEAGKRPPPIQLKSPALTPDRPLTLSLWYRLDAPMVAETCLHLVTLRGGRGMVANFIRGKGEWCALKEPRFVFQVVYYEGIPDINGIWDGNAWLEPSVWHHAAMVFANASEVDVYWDGQRRSHHMIKGRRFVATDGGVVEFGPNWLFHPMTLDDIMVVDRALTGDEIAAYVLAVHRRREVHCPALSPR